MSPPQQREDAHGRLRRVEGRLGNRDPRSRKRPTPERATDQRRHAEDDVFDARAARADDIDIYTDRASALALRGISMDYRFEHFSAGLLKEDAAFTDAGA